MLLQAIFHTYVLYKQGVLRGYERLNSINGGKGAMKNRVIKKIMAYLLVGAMVITTPMTASATESELQKAYGERSDSDTDNDEKKLWSNSDSDTNTRTSTQATVPIPETVQKHEMN